MQFSFLETLTLVFDTGCLVLIWMVQLVVYPGFRYYPGPQLLQWHKKYTFLVTWIVLPLMLGQLICGSIDVIIDFTTITLFRVILIAMTWVLTFVVFVPLHRALETASAQQPIVQKLVRKNWSRTTLWTLLFAITITELWVSK